MRQETDNGKRYLSRVAAAKYLGLCARYVDRLVASGKLPVVRIGRRVLLDAADLDKFMAAHKTAAGAV